MPTPTEMDPAPPTTPSTPSTTPPREPWGWTRPQRIALGTLSAILLFLLIYQLWQRPYRLNDPVTVGTTSLPALPQKMNPNTATTAQLARIPHIGETLATRITDYRDARKPTTPDGIVFHTLSDLDNIPGIGKKLLDQLAPFLDFPAPTPDDNE